MTAIADPLALPLANALVNCLTIQLANSVGGLPAYLGLRTGAEAGPLIGPNVDECCSGIGWVRVVRVFPAARSFPQPDTDVMQCGPLMWGVTLEMGVARCAIPWSSNEDPDSTDPPTQAQWDLGTQTVLSDMAAMARAASCCFSVPHRFTVGPWEPLSVEAGCTGGTMQVTVTAINSCGDC